MRIVLASKSPRRQELLKKILPEFEIHPADINEFLPSQISFVKAAEFLASQKACATAQETGADITIGCDTIVVCDGEIMGKPTDYLDAFRMLKKLSGKAHTVYTGVCIIAPDTTVAFTEATKVYFSKLSNDEIRTYVQSGDCNDKAGAYGIQGDAAKFVEKIEGDYFNVVGLPLNRLYRELKKILPDKI